MRRNKKFILTKKLNDNSLSGFTKCIRKSGVETKKDFISWALNHFEQFDFEFAKMIVNMWDYVNENP